jgi:SAM-dependent methyltransferase
VGLRPDRKSLSRRLLERVLRERLRRIDISGDGGSNGSRPPICVDVGGVGRYREWLPNGRFVSVDLDLSHRPQVVGRAEALPLVSGSASFVVSTEMLEHCPEPAAAAREMHRVLRPGGALVLTTPFVYVVHGWPHDYFRFTDAGLRHLFRDFRQVDVFPFGNRFTTAYDLLVGLTPFVSSWVSPILFPLVRASRSRTCPSGHVVVATK